MAIGFVTPSLTSVVWGEDPSDWALPGSLVGTLLMLRVVPAVVRKVVPFSAHVRAVWAGRRQIAKRYDSYQWRKLFWIGFGLVLYTAFSGQVSTSRAATSSLCLLAGGLGLARWRVVASQWTLRQFLRIGNAIPE